MDANAHCRKPAAQPEASKAYVLAQVIVSAGVVARGSAASQSDRVVSPHGDVPVDEGMELCRVVVDCAFCAMKRSFGAFMRQEKKLERTDA